MPYSYTPAQARDHIYTKFFTTWKDPVKGWAGIVDAQGAPINLSQEPKLEWDNDIDDNIPDITEPYVYIYVRHYSSRVSHIGGETRRGQTRKGFVLAKVIVPLDMGLKTADALGYIVKTAFENKRALGAGAGIIFRSWRPTENGTIGALQLNGADRFAIVSTVDFEYDEHTEE